MRHAAQRTLQMQDMLPADGSVYMVNMDNKIQSVMDALKAWEKKRGISFSYKGRFIENRPKKVEEKAKDVPVVDRPVEAPRERKKPGRKPTLTKEERKQRKNESNKQARNKNKAHHAAASRAWRANLSEEERQRILAYNREWKRAKKLAANLGNGGGKTGVPLANPVVS